MIVIFFPVGGFGSLLELLIRNHSEEFNSVNAPVHKNGSMHTFPKEFHPSTLNALEKIKEKNYNIITPLWPGDRYDLEPKEYIKQASKYFSESKVLFVYPQHRDQFEIIQLFAYHKLKNNEIKIDPLENCAKNFKFWNTNYKSHLDMERWELRECISFHLNNYKSYISAKDYAKKSWLKITLDDILFDLKNTVIKIIDYFNLTKKDIDKIEKFYNNWFLHQEYVLNEHALTTEIIKNLQENKDFAWGEISIIAESIIQARISDMNFEIQCYNLNSFPKDVRSLKKLIKPK